MTPSSKNILLRDVVCVKRRLEQEIRSEFLESVILQVHEGLYSVIKQNTEVLTTSIDVSLRDLINTASTSAVNIQYKNAIRKLRNLIATDAKERHLQNALVESGLLELGCKVVQEVSIKASKDRRGMRMDIVVNQYKDKVTEIIELKRGCHLLIARCGKPAMRLSQTLNKAIKQVKKYGDSIKADALTARDLEKRLEMPFNDLSLRLIAGRRLSTTNEYSLISVGKAKTSNYDLQIYVQTWDGFLAELERITD